MGETATNVQDDLTPEQRARLCIISNLIDVSTTDLDAFDLLRFAYWVDTGNDPDQHTLVKDTLGPDAARWSAETAGVYEMRRDDPTRGTYTITIPATGRTSDPLPYNCTAEQHANAVRALWAPAVQ